MSLQATSFFTIATLSFYIFKIYKPQPLRSLYHQVKNSFLAQIIYVEILRFNIRHRGFGVLGFWGFEILGTRIAIHAMCVVGFIKGSA